MGVPELARMAKCAYLGSIALAGPVLRELLTHYPRYPAINNAALVFLEATALIHAGTAAAAGIDSIDKLYVLAQPVFHLQRTLWRAKAQSDYEAVRDASSDKITRRFSFPKRALAERGQRFPLHNEWERPPPPPNQLIINRCASACGISRA